MFKKFLKNRWLVSLILLGFTVLFGGLKAVWAAFAFFAIPFLSLFCVYWIVIFILEYIQDYYKYFDDEFKQYRAETVNLKNITTAEFDANVEFYIKKFKKSLRLDKFIDIFKILFVLSIFAILIVALFKI